MRTNCIVCENPIHRSHNKKGIKRRRSPNSVTCSKRCAKIYQRINVYVRVRMRNKREKEERNKK